MFKYSNANETKADIEHIRRELMLTVREVAQALAKRGRSPEVLRDVAGDLLREAAELRRLAE